MEEKKGKNREKRNKISLVAVLPNKMVDPPGFEPGTSGSPVFG